MRDFFQKFTDIIHADYKESFSGGLIKLQDSTSKEIKLTKKGNFLCIQLDRKNKSIFPFFETSVQGLCSVADRVVVYLSDGTLFIFIFEIKSSNPTGAMKQVRATFELTKYIVNTVKRLMNLREIDVQYRGIVFTHKIIKGKTKPKNLDYFEDTLSEMKHKHLQSGRTYDLDTLTR